MTEIQFHFNVPEPVDYACRLLRKAWRRQAQVAVVAPEGELAALDGALWRLSPVDFIPHARTAAASQVPARLHAATVWLCEDPDTVPAPHTLVNLGPAMPRGFESYQRLIELVGTDEPARAAARDRWRGYVKRGYAIQRHEVGAS